MLAFILCQWLNYIVHYSCLIFFIILYQLKFIERGLNEFRGCFKRNERGFWLCLMFNYESLVGNLIMNCLLFDVSVMISCLCI